MPQYPFHLLHQDNVICQVTVGHIVFSAKKIPSGCIVYSSFHDTISKSNYSGAFSCVKIRGRKIPPHRYIYEHLHGGLPWGVRIIHTCGNTFCLNPEHLLRVTATEYATIVGSADRHQGLAAAGFHVDGQRIRRQTGWHNIKIEDLVLGPQEKIITVGALQLLVSPDVSGCLHLEAFGHNNRVCGSLDCGPICGIGIPLRYLYRMTHTPVHRSKTITQSCGHSRCVNPEHLIAVIKPLPDPLAEIPEVGAPCASQEQIRIGDFVFATTKNRPTKVPTDCLVVTAGRPLDSMEWFSPGPRLANLERAGRKIPLDYYLCHHSSPEPVGLRHPVKTCGHLRCVNTRHVIPMTAAEKREYLKHGEWYLMYHFGVNKYGRPAPPPQKGAPNIDRFLRAGGHILQIPHHQLVVRNTPSGCIDLLAYWTPRGRLTINPHYATTDDIVAHRFTSYYPAPPKHCSIVHSCANHYCLSLDHLMTIPTDQIDTFYALGNNERVMLQQAWLNELYQTGQLPLFAQAEREPAPEEDTPDPCHARITREEDLYRAAIPGLVSATGPTRQIALERLEQLVATIQQLDL